MTEPKRWTALDRRDPRRTALPTVEVVAAADFDRLRDERDRAIAQREQAAGTRNVIAAERDLAIDRLDAVSRERDRLRDERDRLRQELNEALGWSAKDANEAREARRVAGVLADALRNNAPCYCDHPLRAGLPPCSRCSALAVFDTLTEGEDR